MLKKLNFQELYDDWYWYLDSLRELLEGINKCEEPQIRTVVKRLKRKLNRVYRRLHKGNLDVFEIVQEQRDILERRLDDIKAPIKFFRDPLALRRLIGIEADELETSGTVYCLQQYYERANIGRLELGSLLQDKDSSDPVETRRELTVEEAMSKNYKKDNRSIDWSAREWADILTKQGTKCTKQSVANTKFWKKFIMPERERRKKALQRARF